MKKTSKKTVSASFRLLPDVLNKINSRANEAGLSAKEWLNKAILENKTKIISRQKPHPELRPLLFQVNKAGNDINQIAHHFNMLKQTNEMTRADYLDALDKLGKIHESLRNALLRSP